MRRFAFFLFSLGLVACAQQTAVPEPDADGSILSKDGLRLIPVARDLEFPWGLAQLPNGDLLVTEREGRLRLIRNGELVSQPVTGIPDNAFIEVQSGYLGLALDPAFVNNRRLYMSYGKGTSDQNTTAVIVGTLSEDGTALRDVEEIFTGAENDTAYHFGSRIDFLPDGTLLVTLGEGARYTQNAQDTNSLHGKIVRINKDGSIPEDNPFVSGGGHPAVYSYGHRNVQGLQIDAARGLVFAHEHGPRGGDELNVIVPGNNYGWPVITYGINYDGTVITDKTEAPGMEQPVIKWVPSIAPSGMTLVETAGFEDWSGDLLIGAMNGPDGRKLVRVDLDEAGNVIETEDILSDVRLGYRDVLSTPDAIYLATNDLDGAIYRLEKE